MRQVEDIPMTTDSNATAAPAAEMMPRRVSALITYLRPFRIVEKTSEKTWNASLDQINSGTWDYIKLHEVVGGIDVGLASPYHMLIGFDGALALPPLPKLRPISVAVEFFNRCLAAILIGGVYCEAADLDHVEVGSVFDWKYIRAYGQGRSFDNQFHHAARMKGVAPLHAINLLGPRSITLSVLRNAAKKGFSVVSSLPELSPEFLLKGVSGLARRDWASALGALWITAEQLTSNLWKKELLEQPDIINNVVPGRKDQLVDNRTWAASNKQELLYQKNVIDLSTLRGVFTARKARNDLVHNGRHPVEESAAAAFEAVKGLLRTAAKDDDIPLFRLNLSDHTLSDPFQPRDEGPLNPQYWIPIPKLPGEEEFEREEAKKEAQEWEEELEGEEEGTPLPTDDPP
jgi:hypothetical protein